MRTIALDQPEQRGGVQLRLDQADEPDRSEEEQADREGERDRERAGPRRARERAGPPSPSLPSTGASCALAEMFSARRPIAIEPPSATTPRSSGRRSTRWRRSAEVNGNACTSIPPSGISRSPRSSCAASRCAHGHGPGPHAAHHHALEHGLSPDRRVAPGPRHARALLRRGGLLAAASRAALEALDATARVDQLLPARVERVAVRADLDAELGLRGARLELVSAGAADGRRRVLRMDVALHVNTKCSGGATRPTRRSRRCGCARSRPAR